MKLHLPKTLLAAVVAVGFAMPPAFAEGESQTGSIGNSYDAQYTYAGNVYTMSATAKNDTLADMYETTRDATNPSSWTQSDTATATSWAKIYGSNTDNGNNPYNTLRIVAGTQYGFKFNNLSIGSLIVEESGDGAKIYSFSSADRNIYYGTSGLTADSYFAGSFTLDNTNANDGIDITIAGTQNWYIAGGKTVSLAAKDEIINNGTWNISGGTVSVNGTVNNTGGTLSLKDGAGLHVTNIDLLDVSYDIDMSGVTENGATQVTRKYIVIDGGSSDVSSITYTSSGSTVSKTLTDHSYFTDACDAYAVVTNTNVESIKDTPEGIIVIGQDATLTRGGASFASAKQLAGDGTYDMGALGKGTWANLTNNVSIHDAWTGTISLSGGEFAKDDGNNNNVNAKCVQAIDFNSLGNANSTIEIAEAGLYGYFTGNGNSTTTFNPNISLKGDLTIQNANSGTTHIFAGKVTGDGDIVVARTGGSPCTLTFSNDISGWQGSLLQTRNESSTNVWTTNINLNGQATVVNATIDALAVLKDGDGNDLTTEGNYLNLFVDNSGKTTTFNKDVTVSKLRTSSAIALGEGVTLTLTQDNGDTGTGSTISNITAHADGNTIELKSGATLSRIASKSGGTLTLKGAGTYDMRGNLTENVAGLNAADWTGKVIVSGTTAGKNLNNLGNGASSIEIGTDGLTGYWDNSSNTYEWDLIMSGNFTQNNGWSGNSKTIAGDVSGNGNFVVAFNAADMGDDTSSFTPQWTFSGDVSQWKGEFRIDDVDGKRKSVGTVKFTGTSEINLTKITDATRSTLDVTISDADQGTTKSAVAVASEITVEKLTVNTQEGVALNGTTTVDTLDIAGGTVSGSGDVSVGTTLKLNSDNAFALTGNLLLGDGATVDVSALTSTILNGTETSYTLGTAGTIDLGDGVILSGLTFGEGSKFTGAELIVQDVPATFDASASTPTQVLVLELTPATTTTTLTEVNVMENGATSYADGVLTLQTEEKLADFSGLGDKLNVVIGDALWEKLVADYKIGTMVDVALTDAAGNYFDLDGTNAAGDEVTVTLNGIGTNNVPSDYGSASGVDGAVVGSYVTSYIPEPTSTTLSLLALAALAVRRRRK